MLDALGVVAYSRVRRAKAAQPSTSSDLTARDARANLQKDQNVPVLPRQSASAHALPVTSVPVVARPVAKMPIPSRVPSTRSELVLPSAELERFLESRMYRHFCLLFAQGITIPAVENAVLSDTALHFEMPPKSPLKLGSMALLRSAWRAKRQAWLAIRLWRKQQR